MPLEKTLTLVNVIILIKLVFNKDKNYYDNIFLEKCSYKWFKYGSIDVSEELMLIKQMNQQSDICHYCLDNGFKF